jgi:predicted membrane channel-forming protein YqfA (hemolysin III family)
MDKYELAEKGSKNDLPELHKSFPKTVEFILLVKAIFASIFSTEIDDSDIYNVIVGMWIVEGIISACVLLIGLLKRQPEPLGTILLIVVALQVICMVIHMMVGHMKER